MKTKSDNLIQMSGFLTKDATTNSRCSYASFSIAHRISKHEAMYFNCIAFASDTKIPFDLLKKGKEIFVMGYLKPNSYTSADGGTTYNGYQIIVSKIRDNDD